MNSVFKNDKLAKFAKLRKVFIVTGPPNTLQVILKKEMTGSVFYNKK